MEPWHFVAVVLGMAALGGIAYRFAFLDLGGVLLAFLMGLVILFAVGWQWLLLLFFFAGMGFLATRIGARRKRLLLQGSPPDERRGWRNVVGNGATASVVAALGFVVAPGSLALPFAVAVAVAAADTLASEIGSLSSRAVLITRPTRRVPPGVDGGVSLLGTSVSLVAAIAVAVLAVVLLPLSPRLLPVVAAAGLAGSLLDSVLGALWEGSPSAPDRPLSKTQVNVIAITVPTVIVGLLGASL